MTARRAVWKTAAVRSGRFVFYLLSIFLVEVRQPQEAVKQSDGGISLGGAVTRGGAGSGASGTNETRKGTGGLSSSSKGASVRCWSETFRQEAKEKAETQQILDILAALDYYEQLKSAVELKLLRVPFSPGAKAYPAPPAWERAIQRIMQQEIDATLAELLPIFDHGMEKAPLKAFDRYLKESRRSVNQS